MSEIMDFTEAPKMLPPKVFKLNDDIFELTPELPAGASVMLADMVTMSEVQRVAKLGELLDMIFLPASAQRFADRMRSPVKPITSPQLGKILEWIFREYGAFPTQQSSNSAGGLTLTGTSLTAGAPVGV